MTMILVDVSNPIVQSSSFSWYIHLQRKGQVFDPLTKKSHISMDVEFFEKILTSPPVVILRIVLSGRKPSSLFFAKSQLSIANNDNVV